MKRNIIALIAALSTASAAQADTIVLKSGKKLQGRIISEDQQSYLLEIEITKTIKDEKRIAKNLIEEIIRDTEDAIAFEQIASHVPTPDSLTNEAYKNRIAATKNFITRFPSSKLNKKAKEILATLEKEYKIIASGGIKLDGQLIGSSDLEANAYEIDARLIHNQIRQLSSDGKHRQALRKWETLHSEYKNSEAFQKTLPLVRKTLLAYQKNLSSLVATLDARTKKRENAIASLNENDRSRTLALLAENKKKYDALHEKEKTTLNLKWLTIDPYGAAAMNHNLQKITDELSNISNIKASDIKQAGPLYRATWTSIANGQLARAGEQLKELSTIRIPERYLERFTKQLEDKQEAQRIAAEKARQAEQEEKARQEKLAKEAAEKATKEKTPNKKTPTN